MGLEEEAVGLGSSSQTDVIPSVSSKLEYLNRGRGPKEGWPISQWTGLQLGLLSGAQVWESC